LAGFWKIGPQASSFLMSLLSDVVDVLVLTAADQEFLARALRNLAVAPNG
jgi:hypothetical protein